MTAFIHPSMSLCHWFFIVTRWNRLLERHTVAPRVSSETPSVHIVLQWEETGASHRCEENLQTPTNLQTHVSLMSTAWTGHTRSWQCWYCGVPFFLTQSRNMNIKLTGPVNKLFRFCPTSSWCPSMFFFWFVSLFLFFFFFFLAYFG